MTKIEYRVRPVTRYIVTRYEATEPNEAGMQQSGSSVHGEFDNEQTAYEVGYALCRADHERLGWPVDDERIRYPQHPRDPNVRAPLVPDTRYVVSRLGFQPRRAATEGTTS